MDETGRKSLRQEGAVDKQALPWKGQGLATISGLTPLRPERFRPQISIEVCGFDRCGRFFSERSETSNVSEEGCKFYLRTEVERDANVALRAIDRHDRRGNDSAPVLFQVSRIERESSGWALGASKLHGDDMWPAHNAALRGGAPYVRLILGDCAASHNGQSGASVVELSARKGYASFVATVFGR